MTKSDPKTTALPDAIVIGIDGEIDAMLSKEYLLTNQIGAYASSSIIGCNTRRYHGLLVASAAPPVGRFVALTSVMEKLTVDGQTYELATNEFEDVFSPRGMENMVEFRNEVAPTFIYRCGAAQLTKEIILAEDANAVAVRYTAQGAAAELQVWPFAALRDFHHVRMVHQPHQMTSEQIGNGIIVQDLSHPEYSLHMTAEGSTFQPKSQWWYRFRYRVDLARGQDGSEDLYTPGCFVFELPDGGSCQFTASADKPLAIDFDTIVSRRRRRLSALAESVGADADETTRRLAVASDAFIVQRSFKNNGWKSSATILAGYHWFADWGRDAFIALPGLLLSTGRFEQAKEVFRTFAAHISEGMIPNCFDDYSGQPHYNSIDASLWFIIAAERYLQAGGDSDFWHDTLMPSANAILSAYRNGTRFDIHADVDGLLEGGSHQTQLTWMDAKLGEEVVTPRHGKAVEINALWHSAHRIMAERCRGIDETLAQHYAEAAEIIAPAFVSTFWNNIENCLYDCVVDGQSDNTFRPNQIFAVSLPHSPLSHEQQSHIVNSVAEHLLTPMGLRTLRPDDPRYRRRYGGSWESRDRAYHQGTVWAWLTGAFIEAYLKVEGPKPFAVERARKWLTMFEGHLSEAGLGFVGEIFDGDPPHSPRGCIAQAWSVAELLRARQLVETCAKQTP